MSLLNKHFVCILIVEVFLVLNELLASPLGMLHKYYVSRRLLKANYIAKYNKVDSK